MNNTGPFSLQSITSSSLQGKKVKLWYLENDFGQAKSGFIEKPI